jgi:hypothetical protein
MNTTRIQIIKVNDLRSGVSKKTGNKYEMQDCEAIILNPDGTPESVGVLMLPKDMVGKAAPVPGTYDAAFTLGTDQERRVVARIVTLTPVKLNVAQKAA